jgi:hypothetical protein
MKSKYLIQTITNNANMGVFGWHTINGAMTKAQGLNILNDYQEGWKDKSFRLISTSDFKKTIQEANRAAFNTSKR